MKDHMLDVQFMACSDRPRDTCRNVEPYDTSAAAARRRQPFLMHKMSFHRARVLSLLECSLKSMGVEPFQEFDPKEHPEVVMSEDLAPKLEASQAEVFLPYSLPG